MAQQFRVTPDQLRMRADQYRREAEKLEEVIQRMDNLLGALQGEWEGAASESFASMYSERKVDFMQMQSLIQDLASALNATANAFEEMDAKIAQAIADMGATSPYGVYPIHKIPIWSVMK